MSAANSQVLFPPRAQFCSQSCTSDLSLEHQFSCSSPAGPSIWPTVPSWFSRALSYFAFHRCDKILTKSNSGRKGFISAYSLQSVVKGSQGRNLEAGTEVEEAIEERCFLARFSWFVQLIQLRTPCPVVAPHSGLGLLISTINLENAPQIIPTGQSDGVNFLFFQAFFFIRYFLHLHFKCYPQSPLYPPPTLLPNPPTPASWPWHSPVLGRMIFARPRASPPIDGRLGHPLLHMQLETQLWGGGVLVSSYCCSTYRVADPFSSLGTFSSSFIRGPMFHPIDDCEHPLMCLPGTGIGSDGAHR
jgi:hypothetical protein